MVTRYFDRHIGQVVLHDIHCTDHSVEIGQRLAHAHQHHIGRPVCPCAGGNPDLPDDLGHAQVAVEALLRGGTEADS